MAASPSQALPPAVADRLGFLFAKAHQEMLALARLLPDPDQHGLTGKHFGCLSVIASEGPLSQQALGERLRVDRTTIVAVVDDLEAAGFVERRRNPEDRRAYALHATPKGKAWLERVAPRVLAAERELLTPLSAAERRQLVSLLQRILTR
jgi:DNA-binding MarR family transcriptional regulator